MKRRRAIVTGGFGFIGSALCRKLCQEGWEVIVFENMEGGVARQISCNTNDVVQIRNVEMSQLFTVNEEEYWDVDWFFHFAAHYANEKSLEEPIASVRSNVIGTMAALEFCVTHRIEHFCYASSSGVYGMYNGSEYLYTEDMLPAPATPYEVGKYSGELLCRGWGAIHELDIVCPRFFNVYGVGDVPGRWRSVVPNFFKKALRGDNILVTGEQASRDFTYIDDCIQGILVGVETAENSVDRADLVYNIATQVETPIKWLAEQIVDLVNSKSQIRVIPKRPWDNAERRVGSSTKMEQMYPAFTRRMTRMDEGLKLSKDWYVKTCS